MNASKKTRIVTAKFTPEMYSSLVALADEDHRSVTNMLECLILDELRRRNQENKNAA